VLEAPETELLLREVTGAYLAEIREILLAPLVAAVAKWSGQDSVLIEVEGHGREELDELDLDRTVGWFTTFSPARFELGPNRTAGNVLLAVKEQLRNTPRRGLGYGALRYLHPDPEFRQRLAAQATPEISFEYLGQFDQVFTEHSTLAPAPESSGQPRASVGTRKYPLSFGGGVFGGRLTLSWTYASECFDETALSGLAEDYMNVLRQLIRERGLGSRSYAPSDFPRAKLDKQGLARTLSRVGVARTRRGT